MVANEAIARNLIIIAGGVDDNNALSVYATGGSNQAGSAANHYVTALATRVRTINENGAAIFASGTSYAAPAVAGGTLAVPTTVVAAIVDPTLTVGAGTAATARVAG